MMLTLPFAVLVAASAPPPNLDVFFDDVSERPRPPKLPGVTHVEPRLGVPTFTWAFRVGAAAPAWSRADLTPAQAARRYLLELAPLYRLSGESVARAEALHTHDLGHGALVVTFGRRIDGVPLFRDEVHVVMTWRRELVAISGNLNPNQPKGDAASSFRITAETATATAALDLHTMVGELAVKAEPGTDWLRVFDPLRQLKTARARKVWYGLADGLEPAWHVELDTGEAAFFEVISARDGRLLSRKNLSEDADKTYRVYADAVAPFTPDDSPYGKLFTPHPTGVRLPPIDGPFIAARLVTLDFAPGRRQDPWLPATATTLDGNNAFAFAELYPPSGRNEPDSGLPDGGILPVDPLVTPSGPNTFDFTYDLDAGPEAAHQVSAATTHLFFTVNWLHDWLANAGFDEAARNGQRDNLGRGGLARDALIVSALDYRSPENASMATFGDGEASRMSMGNFTGSSLEYLDLSGLDAGRVYTSRPPRTSLPQFNVTAPTVLLQSDAGSNACEALSDLSTVAGRIAVAMADCELLKQADRALDAGALGLLYVSRTPQYPSLFTPDGSVGLPVMGVSQFAASALFQAFDAGALVTTSLVGLDAPTRPSALDSQVITHEFGHFVSNRLISDSAGLTLQISRSMGEGWSDFLALLATVEAKDATSPGNRDFGGAFAVGGFVRGGQDFDGKPLQHHWFGIRRVPYSIDFEKNGLSFRHIRDGAALPRGALAASKNSEVHNAGEVWCSMLWEGFAGLLRSPRTFEASRTLMLELFVASLKATPTNPDFLEARDALLAVAFATDPAAFEALYQGFAKRGAGPRAIAPNKVSTGNAPVVEDTGTGNYLKVIGATADDSRTWCDRDGTLDVGEAGVLTLTARNLSIAGLSAPQAVSISALSPGVVIDGSGLTTFPAAPPFGLVTAQVPVRLEATSGVRTLEFRVDVVGETAALPTIVTVLSNADRVPSVIEDFESPIALDRGMGWRRGNDLVVEDYVSDDQWKTEALTETSTVMYGPNANAAGRTWLTTPPLIVGQSTFSMRFKSRWDFETAPMKDYDGASFEISDDDERTWTTVPGSSVSPTYNGVISTINFDNSPSRNPYAGRPALVRTSPGYPAFVPQTLSFGRQYAGKTVKVRFVIATDRNGVRTGWDLDDIELIGVMGTPFTQRVADRMVCTQRPPTVEAGPPRAVNARSKVTLTAMAEDPDGDPVTLTWAQVAGPQVTLEGATFTAPIVLVDTALTFEVTARDATFEAKDQLVLTVKPVNTAPRLMVSGPAVVRSGQPLNLTASVGDDDGDEVQVSWVQTRGPLAKGGEGGRFVAPFVKDPDRLYFEATAFDGQATSKAQLDVGLEPSACGCSSSALNGVMGLVAMVLLRRLRRRRRGPAF